MSEKYNSFHKVGYEMIDNQHEKIHSQIERMELILIKNRSVNEIKLAFVQLKDMVNLHLDTEERLMKKYNYPDYRAHVAEHNTFRSNMSKVEMVLNFNVNKSILHETMRNQKSEWFSDHIRSHDRELANFLTDPDRMNNRNVINKTSQV